MNGVSILRGAVMVLAGGCLGFEADLQAGHVILLSTRTPVERGGHRNLDFHPSGNRCLDRIRVELSSNGGRVEASGICVVEVIHWRW